MLVAIAFAALRLQAQGPVLPPSCSPSFQATVLSVEESLEKSDFSTAGAKLKLLPKLSVGVTWDDHKVPDAYRAAFRRAGEQAVSAWQKNSPGLHFEFVQNGDIHISFEPVLAKRPGTEMPAAHVGFWSEEPGSPRLDFVIGLKRGIPLKSSEEVDIFNDVAYCFGSYMGLADGISELDVMAPTDLPRPARTEISRVEGLTLRGNFQVVRQLEKAVQQKIALTPTKAQLFIDPVTLDSPPAIQGDRVEFNVQLSNNGNGPLSFSLVPDCGCTVVSEPGVVDPGSARIVKFAVDTTSFASDTTKHIAIYTNDPVTPVQTVTLNVHLKPSYRLLAPLGDSVVVPAGGLKFPLYFIPFKGSNLDPVSVTVSGTLGSKVSFAPWQGVLADPELHEGPKLRKGYKVVLSIDGEIGRSRNQATISILTANAQFPSITYSVNAQKGIIALPDVVSMGEVGRVPKSSHFQVYRPKAPFKILGITTNSESVTASIVPGTGPETYSIEVQYNGHGKSGDMIVSVKVRTDDPHQPVIDVPVIATVR